MDTLVVEAPAKVNLFLHVVGRREGGYHDIESLFALVDLADTVRLTCTPDDAIVRVQDLAGISEVADLSIRAARAIKEATGCRQGVAISVDKRIPEGAGLGGGSSDAASVLLGLNRLWKLALSRADLERLGATLGADVPFFVQGTPAFVEGIGDRITPVSLPPTWIALATPPVRISTAEVFAAPDLTRKTPSAKMNVFSEGYGRNDLSGVVERKCAAVAQAIAALRRASPFARMTGSGSCVIAPFRTEQQAREALAGLPAGTGGRVVRTLTRHPLHAFA